MGTKIMAVVLIVAGLVGLVWGAIAMVRGIVAARQTAAFLSQWGRGRLQGGEGMAPGGDLPAARLAGAGNYNTILGGLMGMVSLLLIGVGMVLWRLAAWSAALLGAEGRGSEVRL